MVSTRHQRIVVFQPRDAAIEQGTVAKNTRKKSEPKNTKQYQTALNGNALTPRKTLQKELYKNQKIIDTVHLHGIERGDKFEASEVCVLFFRLTSDF